MMDYGNSQAATPLGARPMPELGKLKHASERVSIAAQKINHFIERFNGPIPPGSIGAGDQLCPADSYRNDLESLFAQIGRLESCVPALDDIG